MVAKGTKESGLADLHFLRVGDHRLDLPSYATSGSAGLDLCAAQGHRIDPGERKLVGTGFAIALPSNCEGQIRPRSGLAARSGLTVLNAPAGIVGRAGKWGQIGAAARVMERIKAQFDPAGVLPQGAWTAQEG